MKIFSAVQIKRWDEYTIANEPIESIHLMERAAGKCTKWLTNKFSSNFQFKIFCGRGNNGGDGLAIARLLTDENYNVAVYIPGPNPGSEDFQKNYRALQNTPVKINEPESLEDLPEIALNDIVIDALFGTGLNKPVKELYAALINKINDSKATVVSIDMPSGLFADKTSRNYTRVKADYTLSFQLPKLSFFLNENWDRMGQVAILDIGLSKKFLNKERSKYFLTCEEVISKIYVSRKNNAHKGDFGYACLVAGSYGMMGAAVLSAKACLRSGIGKLTCFIPSEGYNILQTNAPEAMCKTFGKKYIRNIHDFKHFDAIGIGPGIGEHISHKELFKKLFNEFGKPLVIDADGLNALSKDPSLYKAIPRDSILTPHPKEFERLFGRTKDNFEQLDLALSKAKELQIYIVLKGHYTFIATPDDIGYFNSTGNSGMATAGSGDVLTGIITGLLGQGYSSLESCLLGVYIHGLAGDMAANHLSKEAMIAGDLVEFLGKAFLQIGN
ncbi:bifunctional ADP-dependent NAD(P)H-hydrate dehydratase/NAD(P)H-hydrate epimerase [soil metagenome]